MLYLQRFKRRTIKDREIFRWPHWKNAFPMELCLLHLLSWKEEFKRLYRARVLHFDQVQPTWRGSWRRLGAFRRSNWVWQCWKAQGINRYSRPTKQQDRLKYRKDWWKNHRIQLNHWIVCSRMIYAIKIYNLLFEIL